jgi:hypothetical protein
MTFGRRGLAVSDSSLGKHGTAEVGPGTQVSDFRDKCKSNRRIHFQFAALPSSLGPLHLMLADAPWPHGFGATLANVGTLSEGFERSVASPLQPRRLRATGRTV